MGKLLTATLLVFSMTLAFSATTRAGVVFSGDGSPADVGYTWDPAGGSGNIGDSFEFDKPSPGFMHEIGSGPNSGRWQLKDPVLSSELDGNAGWFVEARLEILDHMGPGGIFLVRGTTGGILINLRQNEFEIGVTGGQTVNVPTGQGFHTFRLEMPAGGSALDVFVDGVSRGSVATDTSGPELNFSDGNNQRGLLANWDYLVVNSEIPEPATLSLLGLGGALVLFRRRQR